MLTSWVAEPLLTGPGRRRLHDGRGRRRASADAAGLLRRRARHGRAATSAASSSPVEVSFGDATQVFNVGAASVGAYGNPAGIEAAARRWGTVPLDRARRARRRARPRGRADRTQQAYCRDPRRDPAPRPHRRAERPAARGRRVPATTSWPTTIERLGADGAAPFYTGDIAAAVVAELGAARRRADRRRTSRPTSRARASRCASAYRGREVLTNPPPNAGGTLLAHGDGAARGGDRRRVPRCASWTLAHERSERRPGLASPASPSASSPTAGLHDAHLGGRRRGPRLLGDVHQRRGLGRRGPGHRHPPQQHHGRGGPQPARASTPSRRAGGCRR